MIKSKITISNFQYFTLSGVEFLSDKFLIDRSFVEFQERRVLAFLLKWSYSWF